MSQIGTVAVSAIIHVRLVLVRTLTVSPAMPLGLLQSIAVPVETATLIA